MLLQTVSHETYSLGKDMNEINKKSDFNKIKTRLKCLIEFTQRPKTLVFDN